MDYGINETLKIHNNLYVVLEREASIFNPYSPGIDFSRQNLTSDSDD